jgi:hypothetical protein
MSRGMKVFLGIVLVLVLAGGGLAIYGGQVKPERKTVEQVLPNERFPQ